MTTQDYSQKTSVLSPAAEKAQAGQDPVLVMVDIAKDEALSAADRVALIEYAKNRYRHRRRMAYLALSGVLLSLAILFVIGLFRPESFEALDDSTVLIFIQGFLTSIVATYFGISAWKPSS